MILDDDQIDDRIDEALRYFADYHYDGSQMVYYIYQVQAQDITNRYITMPDNIIGVIDLFEIGNAINTNNIFDIRYQIALNDLYTLTSVSMVPYYMAMQHIQLLEQLLVGRQPLRYNRHMNQCFLDMDWGLVCPGQYLILQAYAIVDPDAFPRCWGDTWLQRYCTCLLAIQQATHMTRYSNLPMMGGRTFDAVRMLTDAQNEKEKLEHEMVYTWSMPARYDRMIH